MTTQTTLDFMDFSYIERAVLVASQPFAKTYCLVKENDGLIKFPGHKGSFCFPHLFSHLIPGMYIIESEALFSD